MKIHFNKSQIRALAFGCKTTVLLLGRGTGKTFVSAMRIQQLANQIPDGVFAYLVPTFVKFKNLISGELKRAFAELGWIYGIHYTINEKFDKKYNIPQAFGEPDNVQYFIKTFYGAIFIVVATSVSGNANAGSFCGAIVEEAKLLNGERFKSDFRPTIRTGTYFRNKYGHLPEYLSLFIISDVPTTTEGKWLFEYKNNMNNTHIHIVGNILLQIQAFEKKIEEIRKKIEASENPKDIWLKTIVSYENQINNFRKLLFFFQKNTTYYLQRTSFDNAEVIGLDTIKRWHQEMSERDFDAAVLSMNLISEEQGFYKTFSLDKHTEDMTNNEYLKELSDGQDIDCYCFNYDKNAQLHIAFDAGFSINAMVVAIYEGKNIKVIAEFYESDLDSLFAKFNDFFGTRVKPKHRNRNIVYHYDHTFVGINANNTRHELAEHYSVAEIAKNTLSKNWFVIDNYIGKTSSYHQRFLFFDKIFSGDTVKINNALEYLPYAIAATSKKEIASAKDNSVQIIKDKSDEANKKIDQRTTTHGCDSFDTVIIGMTTFTTSKSLMIH